MLCSNKIKIDIGETVNHVVMYLQTITPVIFTSMKIHLRAQQNRKQIKQKSNR